MIKSVTLTIKGVSQNSDGRFLEKVAVCASGERRASGSFESANEAFDLPALAIGALLEVCWSHGAAPGATKGAVLLVAGGFDDAFHFPFSSAQLMDPVGVVARHRHTKAVVPSSRKEESSSPAKQKPGICHCSAQSP